MSQQGLFLGCSFTVLGIIVALAGFIALQPAIRSARWPATQGEVLSVIHLRQDGKRRAQVTYRYTVNGREYTGRALSSERRFMGWPGKPGLPAPDTSDVRVYYKPADPTRSVLEPGAGAAIFVPVGLGGLLFLVGLVLSALSFFM